MEKISHIVRGNSRVSSTDLKSSSAVRPGTPSFGRPVGESVHGTEPVGTTAARAVALHQELEDKRSAGNDKIVTQMADSFFMTRIRRPEEPGPEGGKDSGEVGAELAASLRQRNEEAMDPPVGYTPRGSYVDIQA